MRLFREIQLDKPSVYCRLDDDSEKHAIIMPWIALITGPYAPCFQDEENRKS